MTLFSILANLLLPPMGLVWLALLCLVLGWRRAAGVAVLLLGLFAVPAVPRLLLAWLDPAPAAVPADPARAPQAIVILSAEATRLADPAGLDPGLLTLDRLRTGAALQRRTGLPVLVTGGVLPPHRTSLASMMGTSLEQDFGVPVRWRETESRDTWENASLSADILRREGVSRVLLVTHAWHMRRSLLAFRHFGLEATPAPVRPDLLPRLVPTDLTPTPSAWGESYLAVHEWVGLAYYVLRP